MSLVSDSEMAALRGVAESGMTTTVRIYRPTNVRTDDGQESTYPSSPSSTVLGWLYELTPQGATISVIDGAGGIAENFRLLLPYGTDVQPNDKVVIGSSTFYVQHTNSDNTYQPTLNVALRQIV